LRIAIDATPLVEGTGGISRYTAELAGALAKEFPDDEYWLVSDQDWTGGPAETPNLRRGRRPQNFLARRWWLAGLPWELTRLGAAIFHGTDFAVPYLPVTPSVMMFHDTSPWQEGERQVEAAARVRQRTPWLVRLATMIVTPTEAVRREVIERFGLSRSRTAAVPLAASEMFRPAAESEVAEVRARLGIAERYILFVGTAERRKNLRRLAAAWREARLARPGLGLVVVGRPGADSQVLNLQDQPGLIATGPLTDRDVAALLSGAVAFVYPSLYEGFGLPVLEAMQTGAPVVISRDPALLEVAGDAAVGVDALSVRALAESIVQLTTDTHWRRELRERGFRRAAQFSWRRTAIKTREVYVEAVRRF
jgi:glycosyltransferase involved in cell wall biosynthesis